VADVAKKMNTAGEDDLYAAVGYGGVTLHGVLTKIIEAYKRATRTPASPVDISKILNDLKPKKPSGKSSQGILVKGESGVMVRLARCCNPVPGDVISGYITLGRGVSVHQADCRNIMSLPEEFARLIEVEWDTGSVNTYQVPIEITCVDRAGVLSEILMVASEAKINVSAVNAKTHKNKMATITLSMEISNVTQLEGTIGKMRRLKDVYSVQRTTPGKAD
jgi:GTP pyrophosphokinase